MKITLDGVNTDSNNVKTWVGPQTHVYAHTHTYTHTYVCTLSFFIERGVKSCINEIKVEGNQR